MTNNNLTPEQQIWFTTYQQVAGNQSQKLIFAKEAVEAFRAAFPQETQTPESAPVIQSPAPTQTRYPWHEAPEGAVSASTDDSGNGFWHWQEPSDGGDFCAKFKRIKGKFPADNWQNSLELNPALFQSEQPPFQPGDVVRSVYGYNEPPKTVLFCGKNGSGQWMFGSKNFVWICDDFEKIPNPQTAEQ